MCKTDKISTKIKRINASNNNISKTKYIEIQ